MYLTTQKSNIRTITRKETHTHKSRKKKQLSIVFVYKYIDFDMTWQIIQSNDTQFSYIGRRRNESDPKRPKCKNNYETLSRLFDTGGIRVRLN